MGFLRSQTFWCHGRVWAQKALKIMVVGALRKGLGPLSFRVIFLLKSAMVQLLNFLLSYKPMNHQSQLYHYFQTILLFFKRYYYFLSDVIIIQKKVEKENNTASQPPHNTM